MKIIKQPVTLKIESNVFNDGDNEKLKRHGILFPSTLRCIIVGPSNCGKTNVMLNLIEHINGLKFENVYVYSKSLYQPKYVYLEKLLKPIKGIGFYSFNASDNILHPSDAKSNSIFIFDDVACDNQDIIRDYFSMGRHNKIDSFYLCQTYAKIPKHLIRDNANCLVLFKQDDLNLKHVYTDHIGTDMTFDVFKQICSLAWDKVYGFLSIFKDNEMSKEKNMNERKLKKRLIEKRKNVKQKLELLKRGELAQERLLDPITKHLKNIDSKLVQPPPPPPAPSSSLNDYEITKQKSTMLSPNIQTDDYEVSAKKKSILENIDDDDYEEDSENPPSPFKDIMQTSYIDYLDQYEPLPRKYINGMYQDNENKEFDHKYGVRLDTSTEKFMIGDSNLNIEGSDIIIKNKRYKGTQGLYELLFKKNPSNYTQQDEENYQHIVSKTNANRRYYKSNKQIDGSRLKKYKQIIAPITTGKGIFMEVSPNKIDFVHWDDPNELVDRLRLLLASQAAGHTGHMNEITSIIEELREANMIV